MHTLFATLMGCRLGQMRRREEETRAQDAIRAQHHLHQLRRETHRRKTGAQRRRPALYNAAPQSRLAQRLPTSSTPLTANSFALGTSMGSTYPEVVYQPPIQPHVSTTWVQLDKRRLSGGAMARATDKRETDNMGY